MRAVFSALSIAFVVAVGCTVEAPSSSSSNPAEATEATQGTEATQVDELSSGSAADRVICPTICGVGTQCQFRDGTCTEACNPCLCKAHGGTVVKSCPAALSPTEPSLDQAFDQAVKGGLRHRRLRQGHVLLQPELQHLRAQWRVLHPAVLQPRAMTGGPRGRGEE